MTAARTAGTALSSASHSGDDGGVGEGEEEVQSKGWWSKLTESSSYMKVCIYMYTYISVYMYIYIYTESNSDIKVCIYMYTYISVYMYTSIYI